MLAPKDNAISRVMAHHQVVDHYGKDATKKLTEQMLLAHPLDDEHDAPIPKWAAQLLKDKSVGYRTRIKIVMTHHWDITGENPSWRFVPPKDMKEAPPKPPPTWLQSFREKKKKEARDFLVKKTQEENKQ